MVHDSSINATQLEIVEEGCQQNSAKGGDTENETRVRMTLWPARVTYGSQPAATGTGAVNWQDRIESGVPRSLRRALR